jgi:hypothetical protein
MKYRADLHYVWVTPILEDSGKLKFNKHLNMTPISPENAQALFAQDELFSALRMILVTYLATKFDFMDFQKIFLKGSKTIFLPGSRINLFFREDLKAEITQRVQSLLSSIHIFRERSILELKRFTDGRALTEALEEKITWFYHNTLSYGFCYNLRNHALHHASPLHVIDVKISGQKNDLIILIDKASIIGNKALNAKFRERFLEYPEDAVDLYKMLQDYYLVGLEQSFQADVTT